MKRVALLLVVFLVVLSACSGRKDGIPKDAILDENNELNLLGSPLTPEQVKKGLEIPELVVLIKTLPVGTRIGMEGFTELFEAGSNQVYLNSTTLPIVTPDKKIGYIQIVVDENRNLSYGFFEPVEGKSDPLYYLLSSLQEREFAIVFCEGNKYGIDIAYDTLHLLGGNYPYKIVEPENGLAHRYNTKYNVIGYYYFEQSNVLEVSEEYKSSH